MLIQFRSADRMLGIKAIGIYQKGLDAAMSACEKVYAPTIYLDAEKQKAETAADWLVKNLDDMGVGEERELSMPHDAVIALRTAASVYLSQLTKLAEKQSDLLVPLDETNEVTSHVTSLADRLRGQMEMAGVTSVTFATPGATPVTLTGEQFERAVDHLSH